MIKTLKKFSLIFAVFLIVGILNVPTFATTESVDNELVSFEDASNIAIWFVANSIENNPQCGWDEKTRLHIARTMYDGNDDVTGYSFELINKGKENGYVIVSSSLDYNFIQEYAFTGKPLYYNSGMENIEKVYFIAPLEYAVKKDGEIYTTDKNKVKLKSVKSKFKIKEDKEKRKEQKEIIKNFRKKGELDLDIWRLGYDGQLSSADGSYGGIYNLYDYVNDRYGSGWSYDGGNFLWDVTPHLQKSLETDSSGNAVSNCTLTALSTIFEYHMNNGYSNIPSTIQDIYDDVREVAVEYGYTPEDGTWPTKINNIVDDSWSKWGYNGEGNSDYILSFSTGKSEIDNERPFVFNITFGYYANHSITVFGWVEYDKDWSFKRHYYAVYDNWTTSTRYVDYDAWAVSSLGSYTKVLP